MALRPDGAGGCLDDVAGAGPGANRVTCRLEARLESEVGALHLGRWLAETAVRATLPQ